MNSSLPGVIFIRQAELHELGDIDSLCLWLFNQKRIPAENRVKMEIEAGGGERRDRQASST